MPDPGTELEELRRRVEEQSQRIDELQDALHTLAIAVQYRQEEPYLAFLAEHGIAGRRRVALNGVINGVLSRARGDAPSLGQGARAELLEDFPALAEAYLPEPIDRDEAVRIVGEVLGSERPQAAGARGPPRPRPGARRPSGTHRPPGRPPPQHVGHVAPDTRGARRRRTHPHHPFEERHPLSRAGA